MSEKIQTRLGSLYIEIISTCNEKCIYCYNEKIIGQKEQLPLEVITNIILDAKKRGINSIALSGGEPMLHNKFLEILKFCYENNIDVTVITNCSLINEKRADILAQYNPGLQITIDSGIDCIHDLSRGKNTLSIQKKALSLLKEKKYCGQINIRCNLWKKNIEQESVQSVLEFANKYKIMHVKYTLAHKTDFFCDNLSEEDIVKLLAMISNLKKQYSNLDIEFSEETISFGCPFVSENEIIDCGFRIASDGYVYPCQMFSQKQFRLGNVYRDSIDKILDGNELQNFLKLIQVRKFFIPECRDCIGQGICYAGCPAMACIENDNILSIAGNCERRKKEIKKTLFDTLKTNCIV